MASADNDNAIQSLSASVPPGGNDGYRYRDGLPAIFCLPKLATDSRRNQRTQAWRDDDLPCLYIAYK